MVALILTHLQVENCLALGCRRCLSLFATLFSAANVSTTNARLAFTTSTNYLENTNHYYLGRSLKRCADCFHVIIHGLVVCQAIHMQVWGSACISATAGFVKIHFSCAGRLVCLYPHFRFGSVNVQNKGDRTCVRGIVIFWADSSQSSSSTPSLSLCLARVGVAYGLVWL